MDRDGRWVGRTVHWQTTVLTVEDTLRMPEIGIEIPVADIYDGMTFPDDAAE